MNKHVLLGHEEEPKEEVHHLSGWFCTQLPVEGSHGQSAFQSGRRDPWVEEVGRFILH